MIAFFSLLQATEFIEAHLGEPFSPADVARAAYLSTSQLGRLFTHVFHTSPANYILKRRLCEAARALATTDRPITDIALDAQFSAPESFTRAFRRQFLRSPSQYRRDSRRFYELYPPINITEGSYKNMTKYDNTKVREAILAARGTYLLLADLDHLMHINDTLGTPAGDAALAAIADRLDTACGPDARIFRTGNDDFTVLTGARALSDVDAMAERVIALADEDVPYPGGTLRATASMGIVWIAEDEQDAQRVLDNGGRAVAHAKRIGRNRFRHWHDDQDALGHILDAKGTYIILADMDGLKPINDTLGYAAGDAALAALEARIADALAGGMRYYRTGGDEYTILTGSGDEATARGVVERINARAGEDVAYPGGTVKVSVSLGMAKVPLDGEDVQAAIDEADRKMMAVKLERYGERKK